MEAPLLSEQVRPSAKGHPISDTWEYCMDCSQLRLSSGIFIASVFASLTGIWIWTSPESKGKVLDL